LDSVLSKKTMRLSIIFCCLLISFLGGCQSKQIRHLASDAALITPEQTTKGELISYLGQPDAHRKISDNIWEFIYFEDKRSLIDKTPFIGDLSSSDDYEMLRIIITNDKVTECEFSSFDKNDQKWADDFTWEDIK